MTGQHPQIGDPDPWPGFHPKGICCATNGRYGCTVPNNVKHPDVHVAVGFTHVKHVWPVEPNGQPS